MKWQLDRIGFGIDDARGWPPRQCVVTPLAVIVASALLAATTALSAPDSAASATVTNPPAKALELLRVFPNKVRYSPGEQGTVQVALRNPSDQDQTVALASEIVQELARITPGAGRDVTVPLRKTPCRDSARTCCRRSERLWRRAQESP